MAGKTKNRNQRLDDWEKRLVAFENDTRTVRCFDPSVYLKIKMTRTLQKKLFYPRANFLSEDLFSILGAPNQMIFSFINRMACSSEAHAVILWGYHIFLKLYGDNANYNEES